MQKIERVRMRNGAYDWSISPVISDDTIWFERYHLSTWLDYLRMNSRATDRDAKAFQRVNELLISGTTIESHHRLERPIGSVRWTDDAIDHEEDKNSEL
jgi:hypothetical protein